MSKIKILHLIDSLGSGGIEEWVKEIARLYDREKFELRVCAIKKADYGKFSYLKEIESYQVKADVILGEKFEYFLAKILKFNKGSGFLKNWLLIFVYIFFLPLIIFKLFKIIKEFKPQVVHAQLFLSFFLAILVNLFYKTPIIYTNSAFRKHVDKEMGHGIISLIYFLYRHFNSAIAVFFTA